MNLSCMKIYIDFGFTAIKILSTLGATYLKFYRSKGALFLSGMRQEYTLIYFGLILRFIKYKLFDQNTTKKKLCILYYI